MLTPPLPRHADLRKLVAAGARLAGTIPLAELPRVAAILLSTDGRAEVDLQGLVDEEGLKVIEGSVTATLRVQCQRCLEPMDFHATAQVCLALVWREEQIPALPSRVDGLVAGTEPYDLYDLVEEELLLALPLAPRHEDECRVGGFEPVDAVVEESKPSSSNPFAALAGVKLGSE